MAGGRIEELVRVHLCHSGAKRIGGLEGPPLWIIIVLLCY